MHLPRLKLLNLSKNQLSGTVPVFDMPLLQRLILDENNIEDLECLREMQLMPMM